MPIFRKSTYILQNELKVSSGNYNDDNKGFTETYMIEKHQEFRFGVWKFWYPNGKMKFKGLFKDGTFISKKCWNSKGESILCDSLEISEFEKFRMFQEQ